MKVAIVDAYSTGNQISQRLAEQGVESFHIQSVPSIPRLLEKSFLRSDFKINIINDNSWENLLKKVAIQSPTHVIAGSETGVLLADKLSDALGVQGNDLNLSQARRNKYLMLDAVKNAGLAAAWQIKSKNLDDLLSQIPNKNFPLILKPLSSSSGDGFQICSNEADVRQAFDKIMWRRNILGELNEGVLCQAYLRGTEYVVNSVSHDGEHYISDIWEMRHRHSKDIPMVIDSMTLLPPREPKWQVLVDYTKRVLTALGISFGPAHSEVMLTQEGPSLIEVNSRLMGGNIDLCFKEAMNGYDQIDALVDAIVQPKRLYQKLKNGYLLKNHIAEVDFVFYQAGILRDFFKEAEIRNLASFGKFTKMPSIGSVVQRTNSTTNVEGLLYLISEDYAQVAADRDKVVDWQINNQLFNIEALS